MTSPENFGTYLFSYSHEGKRWDFEVKATSLDDAKQRLNKIAFAHYDGVLVASIPVPGSRFFGFLRRLFR
jgi:hypothetical protein